MRLGLIGGIGPAATIVYYQRLCRRVQAEGVAADLTIVNADLFRLIENVNADRRQEAAQDFAALIDRLKDGGCDCATITSLGGHFCFPETAAISSLPLVSAVAPLDEHFASLGIRKIGLLGTSVVMKSLLYGQLARTAAVAPGPDLEALGRMYQDVAVQGRCTDAQRDAFFDAGCRMVREQGAEGILLAGTDLNLAFDGHDPGFPVIDALDVHVEVLADILLGRRAP